MEPFDKPVRGALIFQISDEDNHQMETFSALLAICAGNSPVTGEFPSQRPVTRSFDIFFNLRLNKRLSKQSWGWWFDTPSCPLWCHCNEVWSENNEVGEPWHTPTMSIMTTIPKLLFVILYITKLGAKNLTQPQPSHISVSLFLGTSSLQSQYAPTSLSSGSMRGCWTLSMLCVMFLDSGCQWSRKQACETRSQVKTKVTLGVHCGGRAAHAKASRGQRIEIVIICMVFIVT